ncbi:hypothetical protein Mal15_25400 [Stieleria maiorica]|uniref:Uncharacterized protein n=1 Tax=Stieleria maiorica TaxID=2795974 RepID=A0A5B9MBV8_9BACT|nr:hypothetical protein [Stieleria maiorica]QEF98488.1 hypothetical protein Mal15_25400 [Stieleria maiorica]
MRPQILAAAVCVSVFTASICSAQEADNAAAFAKLADQIAREYVITTDGQPSQLQPDAVLTWTNPLVGEIYGGVYVWTRQGRPLAIASFYKWYRPFTHSSHEFQSLAGVPIRATRSGQKDWHTSTPGVTWKPIPDAPPPGRTASQRMVQMRGLAKRFEFEMTEKDGTQTRLRLLSQPLLRYQSPDADVVDGGLFALAKATDPEALLLIEARDQTDQPEWHYAIARSNFLAMRARYNQQELWDVPRLTSAEIYSATDPYTKYQFD